MSIGANRLWGGVHDSPDVPSAASPATNIIKYQKTDWLVGLKERQLPKCLAPWPLVTGQRVDELA